ncbi:MAG: C4-dicarboxylate ABC transporter permease [Rickettsiales bacterium]|nr:C4-dicarboxylate ABC transporter permease [Rickettsiales bacterium]|tara:strand:- start:1588 stop:2886 length:1299 start_codon:yes stop_codon:yes gene_type:complete
MITWIIGLLMIILLISLGLPIAFSMMTVGFIGLSFIIGIEPALSMVGQVFFDNGMSYTLSILPLFLLMGNFVVKAGLADELYYASNAWLRHKKGGLAMATVIACGGFSSVCGSSLATAATMAKIALPSMKKYGYSDSLSAGVIAAGGTLGILIPPSMILVIYGIITSQDIGKLFLAGIIPGLLGIIGYIISVKLTLWKENKISEQLTPLPTSEKLKSLKGVSGILALFILVMGGIYLGIFTATEAAGIGAFGAFIIVVLKGKLSLSSFKDTLIETVKITSMLFFLLFGAILFSNFINLAGLPNDLRNFLSNFNFNIYTLLLLIFLIYLILGMVLESLSMMLLTVPIFYPLVAEMGGDLIWFGILVVVAVEISLITPPVGLNVHVLKTIVKNKMTLNTIFKGVIPFVFMDIIRLLILLIFPFLTLFLPNNIWS